MASPKLGVFSGFREFWPYYLSEHDNPKTRAVHALGTTLGLAATAAAAVMFSPLLIPAGIAAIYGVLTASHVAFQGNKPATFQHFTLKNALMAVRSDLTMIGMWFTGKLDREYKRLGLDPTGSKHQKPDAGKAARPAPAPAARADSRPSRPSPKGAYGRAAGRPPVPPAGRNDAPAPRQPAP